MSSKHIRIVIRVVSTFFMLILLSFITDLDSMHHFLGDDYCAGHLPENNVRCVFGWGAIHGPSWHYGYRHWLCLICGFAVAAVNIGFLLNEEG